MTAERQVWIVESDPAGAAAALAPCRTIVCDAPGDTEWDLSARRLVWAVTVGTQSQCADVLQAVLRGVAVVVMVHPELEAVAAARFVDDLHRATAQYVADRSVTGLADDQRSLLRALAGGATVQAAAADVGVSVRTATRRLGEARRILGCETNAQAARLSAR